jgi:uncharacterized protein (DUF433 family)
MSYWKEEGGMTQATTDLRKSWQSDDPRDIPAYSVADASHYLNIPAATMRSWVKGQEYSVAGGRKRRFRHVIEPPQGQASLLSFYNLAEAHVLRFLREYHRIPLRTVRAALDYVQKEFGSDRPLIQQEFRTDGVALFVERLGKLVEVSAGGQQVMRKVLEEHLDRIEWEDALASRLYPFTRQNAANAPKTVMIDPRFAFGRTVLVASRVATAVVADRYKAGESIDSLAKDYGCPRLEIEEGIRCELRIQVAA